MMTLEEIRAFKPQILAKAEEYGIENVRVALPADPNRTRTLDEVTLVVTPKPATGWEFFSFAEDLEHEVLQRRVHVLMDDYPANEFYGPYIGGVVPL